jgi:hypothetical protein
MLAQHGVGIEVKGSGLVVTTALDDGRVLAAKASQLGKWAGRSVLEKRLDPYQRPSKSVQILKNNVQATYQQTMRVQRAGKKDVQKDRNKTDQEPKKIRPQVQKAERAATRKNLAERFEQEQGARLPLISREWRSWAAPLKCLMSPGRQDDRVAVAGGGVPPPSP